MKTFFTLKNIILILGVGLFLSSCNPRRGCLDPAAVNFDPYAEIENGTCIYEGSVGFYTNQNGAVIRISVDGYEIGSVQGSTPFVSACEGQNVFTAVLGAGTHRYSATDGIQTWNGTFTIAPNGCFGILLERPTLGSVVFWTDDITTGCGEIDVYLDGTFQDVIGVYHIVTPDCNTFDALILDLLPGNYFYEGVDDCGDWSGYFNVQPNSCSNILLSQFKKGQSGLKKKSNKIREKLKKSQA